MRRFALIALAALAALPAFAADKLVPGTAAPVVDGTVGAKEYQWVSAAADTKLSLALSADGKTLYAAFAAPTAGWVAVGLGSNRMDGAWMVLGYDKGGSQITEQTGSGHSHSDAAAKRLISAVAKAANGSTVLEFAVPAADFVKDGKLGVILAYGQKADFMSRHSWRTSLEVPLGN